MPKHRLNLSTGVCGAFDGNGTGVTFEACLLKGWFVLSGAFVFFGVLFVVFLTKIGYFIFFNLRRLTGHKVVVAVSRDTWNFFRA